MGVAKDGVTGTCDTGDRYETVVATKGGGHIHEEGAPDVRMFDTEDEAWGKWGVAFSDFIREKKGRIHGRHRPMLYKSNDEKRYYIYSRVFVETGRL